mgnify:CR=1 FL=1
MSLQITIATDEGHWVEERITGLITQWQGAGHTVSVVYCADAIPEGDICFPLGCGFLLGPEVLARNSHNLVVHASSLPSGRGWSPLTWQILEGRQEIPIVLFEAKEAVDSGPIYLRETMRFDGTELVDALREAVARHTMSLCERFVATYPQVLEGAEQQSGAESYYPRRTGEDSRLDPHKSLASQFDLLRVADNQRYPAFFELNGKRYVLHVHCDDSLSPAD